MSLTAEDIQTQQFHVRFRGFDVDEVDAFLERVAENFVLVNDDKRELKEKIEKLEMQINEFHSQEKTFQHAIISAQKISDEMQEKSRQEAEERLAAVQEEVDNKREQGRAEIETIEAEIDQLKNSKDKIKDELRTYLQTYLDRLDQDVPLGEEDNTLSLLQSDIEDTPPGSTDEESGYAELPPVGEQEASQEDNIAPEETEQDENLDDLYEKIDLPDDLNLDIHEEQVVNVLRDQSLDLDDEGDEAENLTIPDLEGDMLFSLEDPLDSDHEPDVAINSPDDDPEKLA